MVVRHLIKCLTCNCPITLRIWVGHNPYQEHSFNCPNCMEEIAVGMEVNEQEFTTKVLCVENSEDGAEEGIIINQSPHFIIPEDKLNEDQSFPWMGEAKRLQEGLELPEVKEGAGPTGIDAYISLGGVNNITELWKTIKRGWNLAQNNRRELSSEVLSNYKPRGYSGDPEIEPILFDFCHRLLVPRKIRMFDQVAEEIGQLQKNNSEELLEFRRYFVENNYVDHLDRHFTIFSEYFKNYSEFDQTILYTKNDAEVPDGSVATSHAFKNTKMYYGNSFENYTSNISTLACINNLISGRKYDEFQTMDLAKYLTINKARRAEPFSDQEVFTEFSNCLDSTLRNATHHQSAKLVNHGRTVEYRSGGIGAIRRISYSQYLDKCNQIMLASSALLMVELILARYVKKGSDSNL